jgi:hypothetical protein
MPYSGPAVSAFQKLMRSKADVLRDHICKEMNDLNLERCRCAGGCRLFKVWLQLCSHCDVRNCVVSVSDLPQRA